MKTRKETCKHLLDHEAGTLPVTEELVRDLLQDVLAGHKLMEDSQALCDRWANPGGLNRDSLPLKSCGQKLQRLVDEANDL